MVIRICEGPTAANRHEARVPDLREDHGWHPVTNCGELRRSGGFLEPRSPLRGWTQATAPGRDESRDGAGVNRAPESLVNGLVFTLEGKALVR